MRPSPPPRRTTSRLGASVNGYFFADHRLRDAFGNPALTYGADLSEVAAPKGDKLAFAYDVVSANRNDSRLFIVPLTVGYVKLLADRSADLIPYFRIAGGGAYYDVAVHDGGFDRSFKTFGGVGLAEAGVVFGKRIALKAKYFLFQNRGVPLSGLEVGLTYSFGKV